MNSKLISISAVSAGFVAISLLLGTFVEIADLISVILASVFVLLPLYMNSYKACLITYLAGGVIALLCSGINLLSLVFPTYFAFFGIYPIVRCKLQEKNVNKYLCFILGLIWFIAVAYGAYFYYSLYMGMALEGLPSWVIDYVLYLLPVVAIVFFIVYHRFVLVMRIMIDRYLSRIIK